MPSVQPGQSTYSNQGSQSTQSLRGGGSFGRQGRGRGGGRGKPSPGSSARTASVPGKPPPQKAWCELCKVDCNTLEILEQHKNGKKHKKNLKVHEELQNLTRQQATKNLNMPISGSNPENVASNKPEASGSEPAAAETKAEGASGKGENLIAKPSSGAPPSEKRKDRFNGRGGLKRSMRGGRGGKFMRAHDGSRKPVEPPKPKLGFPLICELCNVKCESQVVYESHIAGKKHLANAKRFQGQKEACGEGLQALYPTIPNVLSASVIPPQAYQQDPQDAQALASMMLAQQNLQDPQAVQATLTQLLNQHGIHDAQTLLIQLIPYLLAQSQVPGLVAAPLAGFGLMNAQNPQSQGVAFPAENGITESKAEQQNVADNAKIETVVANYDKSDDGKCLDESTKGLSESNTVEIENEGVLAKEEPTVS